MAELPSRKSIRLREYDYSSPGAYFVTVCTQDRRCILSDIAVGALHEAPAVNLTDAGRCVQRVIEALPSRFPDLSVEKHVIMPNHIHLLVRISSERALREAPLQQLGKRSLLSQAIGYLKMNSSKAIHAFAPDLNVWQRGYHEHVIRGEKDYPEIWNYIDTNPDKWVLDRYYVE